MTLMDAVGWSASALLFLTVGSQVVVQIREKRTGGVPKYLFLGQLVSSLLFAVYSGMAGNAVFLVSNTFLVLTALVGQAVFWRNRRREGRAAR